MRLPLPENNSEKDYAYYYKFRLLLLLVELVGALAIMLTHARSPHLILPPRLRCETLWVF